MIIKIVRWPQKTERAPGSKNLVEMIFSISCSQTINLCFSLAVIHWGSTLISDALYTSYMKNKWVSHMHPNDKSWKLGFIFGWSRVRTPIRRFRYLCWCGRNTSLYNILRWGRFYGQSIGIIITEPNMWWEDRRLLQCSHSRCVSFDR